jgi:hypothetical protein
VSPQPGAGMTNRRRDAEAHSRAEAMRNRSLRKEAEAREDKEATRQANAAKSATLRALRLARAATDKAPSDLPAAPRRPGDGD